MDIIKGRRPLEFFVVIVMLVILALIALGAFSQANAATPLPEPTPVGGWCTVNPAAEIVIPVCAATEPPHVDPARFTRGFVTYPPAPTGRIADLTSFIDTYGRCSNADVQRPWPGCVGSNLSISQMPRLGSVCVEADVPVGKVASGQFKGVSNFAGKPVLMIVGPSCGVAFPGDGCKKTLLPTDGTGLVWRTGAGTNYTCGIPPGHVAYQFTFPASVANPCTTNTCIVHVKN